MVQAFQVGESRLLRLQPLCLDLLLFGGFSSLTMLLAVRAGKLLVTALRIFHVAAEALLRVALTRVDQVELVTG